jgi:hypothetical protein
MVIDKDDPRGPTTAARAIYVGTELGVYVTVNNGMRWDRFGGTGATEMPVVLVRSLQVFFCRSELVAGTYGRGVWTAPLNRARAAAALVGQPAIAVAIGSFSSTVGLSSPSVAIDWGDGSGIDTTTGSIATAGTTSIVAGNHTWA